jgi:hypothetical protein
LFHCNNLPRCAHEQELLHGTQRPGLGVVSAST